MTFCIFTVLALLALPVLSSADPILLAQKSKNIAGGGGGASGPDYTELTNEAFGLVYDLPGGWEAFPNGPDICVGCTLSLPIGTMGTFDFNASNSPEFTAFVQRLTNGIDEVLFSEVFLLDASGNMRAGAGGGGTESAWFGTPTDLIGREVDFIRLSVDSFTLGPGGSGSPGYSYSAKMTWQFWGSGELAAGGGGNGVTIPEPSSLLLLVSGLAGVIALKVKKERLKFRS